MFDLVISETLGHFFNRFTADAKDCFRNRSFFSLKIQIQLHLKQKNTFAQYFTAFLKFIPSFQHFHAKR